MQTEVRALRYTNLDNLRGYAALIVVLLHGLDGMGIAGALPTAHLAVDFFFALSGFVIAHSYDSKLNSGMTLSSFSWRRMVRLYPLLFAGLTLGTVVAIAKSLITRQPDMLPAIGKSFFVGLSLFPVPWLTKVEHDSGWPLNPPTWSLFAEIAINLIYAGFIARRSNRVLLTLTALGLGISTYLTLFVEGGNGGNHWHDAPLGVARAFYPFLIGVVIRRYLSQLSRFSGFLSARGVAVAVVAILLTPVSGAAAAPFHYALITLVFPWLILVAAVRPQRAPTIGRIDLGHLSYAIYVLHYPLIKVFSFMARKTALSPALMGAVLIAEFASALALAWLADRYFDRPVQAFLNRRAGRTREPTPPLASDAADGPLQRGEASH